VPKSGSSRIKPANASDDAERIKETALEFADARLVERQIMGEAEDEGELGQFRNLQADRAKTEPALAALHRDADVRHQHEHQQHQRTRAEEPDVMPQVIEIEPAHQPATGDRQPHAHELFVEIVVRPLFERHARAEQNREAEDRERHGAHHDEGGGGDGETGTGRSGQRGGG
jgi:hypothetical protein